MALEFEQIDESLPGGGRIELLPGFLAPGQAQELLQALLSKVPWRSDTVRLFGREHRIPRLHQWFGDADAVYTWSGLTMHPEPWSAELAELKSQVEQATGARFNSVLANYYRNGRDSMGWHADDEPELGDTPVIASISLGAERDFVLRYRDKRAGIANIKVPLPSGSLLLMSGTTQRYWQHALPKRGRVQDARVNLTFRLIDGLGKAD
jgi:alkylated DNA repair dioxygenase AlkB